MRTLILLGAALVLSAMTHLPNRKAASDRGSMGVGQSFPLYQGTAINWAAWDIRLSRDKVTPVSPWRLGGACMLGLPAHDALLDSIRDRCLPIISMAPRNREEPVAFQPHGLESPRPAPS